MKHKKAVVSRPSPEVRLKSHQLRNYVALLLQIAVFYLQESLPARVEDPHGSHSDPIYATRVYDPLYQIHQLGIHFSSHLDLLNTNIAS